jgi:hypothetical protein
MTFHLSFVGARPRACPACRTLYLMTAGTHGGVPLQYRVVSGLESLSGGRFGILRVPIW